MGVVVEAAAGVGKAPHRLPRQGPQGIGIAPKLLPDGLRGVLGHVVMGGVVTCHLKAAVKLADLLRLRPVKGHGKAAVGDGPLPAEKGGVEIEGGTHAVFAEKLRQALVLAAAVVIGKGQSLFPEFRIQKSHFPSPLSKKRVMSRASSTGSR